MSTPAFADGSLAFFKNLHLLCGLLNFQYVCNIKALVSAREVKAITNSHNLWVSLMISEDPELLSNANQMGLVRFGYDTAGRTGTKYGSLESNML